MLVLSRKESEKIVIGNGIVVTVVRIKGNQVRLGIEAPLEVSIVRSELQERKIVHHVDVFSEIETERSLQEWDSSSVRPR